jgi:hypothetical protein
MKQVSTSSVLYAIQVTAIQVIAIERNYGYGRSANDLVNEPLCMLEATSFNSKRAAANVPFIPKRCLRLAIHILTARWT